MAEVQMVQMVATDLGQAQDDDGDEAVLKLGMAAASVVGYVRVRLSWIALIGSAVSRLTKSQGGKEQEPAGQSAAVCGMKQEWCAYCQRWMLEAVCLVDKGEREEKRKEAFI